MVTGLVIGVVVATAGGSIAGYNMLSKKQPAYAEVLGVDEIKETVQTGWSSFTTPRGFPCCVRFPCVHAVATTPAQGLRALLCSFPQSYQPSLQWRASRPVQRLFRGLLSVHSRYGLHTR
jgi:hypothetical protein